MVVVRQVGTLIYKNLLIALRRHRWATVFRALTLPVVAVAYLTFVRRLFIPANQYGVGTPVPVLSLGQALGAASGDRHNLVFVNNGYDGGPIDRVIDSVVSNVPSTVNVSRFSHPSDILTTCRSNLRGVTQCFAAVIFASSPSEGSGGIWNYTLRIDGALGRSVDVGSSRNDQEVFLLPLQHAIDFAIANLNSTVDKAALPNSVSEYPYTDLTQTGLETKIRVNFMNTIIVALAVAYLATMVGVSYHLSGFIATERELGMSSLLEAMMPNLRRWEPKVARIVSYHLSFSLIYLPGWVIMGNIIGAGLFADSSRVLPVLYNILAGLSLASFSILGAVFFKKAQLSGITVCLVIVVFGIIAQVLGSTEKTSIVTALSFLFAPCNYVFYIIWLARYQQQQLPANLLKAAPNNWNLPGIAFWVFLLVQIFLYPVLAIFIERRIHGTASKERMLVNGLDSTPATGGPVSGAVELRNFSKHYRPTLFQRWTNFLRRSPKTTVRAVDDLNLTAGRGQILVLLGANGSGKSTTLDAIAGMNTVTSGTIKVDGSGGIGICPQKNVLWERVTVREHIRIFNGLKSPGRRDTKESLCALIKSIDLDRKASAQARTLSGGQKRKLQLGMMLTGGSSVCCVDEVSSSLDPLSRRKIWDILVAERGQRTIILTTHFLDEADILADYIAILSKGTLRAQGSSVELKDRLGGGYRIRLYTGPGHKQAPLISGINTESSFDETVYVADSSSQAAQIIRRLEVEGIDNYNLSGPTIEDVFLRLAEEARIESDTHLDLGNKGRTDEIGLGEKNHEVATTSVGSQQEKLELLSGSPIGFIRQTWVLYRKRFTLLQRNILPYCAVFIIPVIAAGLMSNLVKGQNLAGCSPEQQVSNFDIQNAANQGQYNLVIGPSNKLANAPSVLRGLAGGSEGFSKIFSNNTIHLVDSAADFKSYISANYANVTPAGIYLGDATSQPMFSYLADSSLYTSVFGQNILDALLTNITISTQYAIFDIPWTPGTGNTLQVLAYFGLVMASSPAFFSLYPTIERVRQVRGLQYSNGVRPLPLWLAYLMFDFSIALFSTSLASIIFAAAAGPVWYQLGYFFLVLILYNMASILFSYVVSLFAKTQLAAFAVCAGGQVALFLVYLIIYLCIITYVSVTKVDNTLLIANYVVSIVTPMGSLTRALFVALNLFSTTCDGNQLASHPGGINQYGQPILYLIIQVLFLFGLLLWHDSVSLWARIRARKPAPVAEAIADEEVIEELHQTSSSNDCLRLLHVTKSFGKNVAVEDLTFGIKRDEVFALLGPNGAGKSTTISLIRGDIQPSRNGGQIFVDDIPVSKHRKRARMQLGVCPQFDAMDQLSVVESLKFYARVRGVRDVEHNVMAVMRAVGLQNYSSRMAAKLSGGNKRKLSLGIALMGNPSVLLLDEPSSGMDAAAKRIMWKTLTGVVVGRSILLTTHSMEEAGALARKVGIMSKRMLALGTPDHLREKYGKAYHCHLIMNTAPNTTGDEMVRLRAWVIERFPSAVVDAKMYHGQMRFAVLAGNQPMEKQTRTTNEDEISGGTVLAGKADGDGIGSIIATLEEHKDELGLGHYSVSPTTLDQVFVSIVEKHNVEEENYENKTSTWWSRKFGRGNR